MMTAVSSKRPVEQLKRDQLAVLLTSWIKAQGTGHTIVPVRSNDNYYNFDPTSQFLQIVNNQDGDTGCPTVFVTFVNIKEGKLEGYQNRIGERCLTECFSNHAFLYVHTSSKAFLALWLTFQLTNLHII